MDKKYFVNKLLYLLTIITPTIAIIWIGGMLIEWIKGVQNQNVSFFLTYGEITLTLFGLTMISAVFEKNKHKSKELKKLFNLSILFLSASISFFFLYSASFIDLTDTWAKSLYLILIIIAWVIAFFGFVYGLFMLLRILLIYVKEE